MLELTVSLKDTETDIGVSWAIEMSKAQLQASEEDFRSVIKRESAKLTNNLLKERTYLVTGSES